MTASAATAATLAAGRIELREVAVSFPAADGGRLVALDGVTDPGNLGAIAVKP